MDPNFLDFFKEAHIPSFILKFCAVLFAFFLLQFTGMESSRYRLQRKLRKLTRALGEVRGATPLQAQRGISAVRLDEIRVALSELEGTPRGWWNRIDQGVEVFINQQDEEGWFLTERARTLLPPEIAINQDFHAAQFSAFPGILTGLGLLGTFIAILLALNKVHFDALNTSTPVTGMPDLINGLSGKFVTSIVALLLSIVFTLREKFVARGLRRDYERLLSTIAETIPYLSPARVLLDIHRLSAKQTVSVSNISSEVVDRFTGAFNEKVVPVLASGMSAEVAERLQTEFRPTMDRMAGSLDQLQLAIIQLESAKKDSVTGELGRMTRTLEVAITDALEKMGTDFRDALSGSARAEFGNVQGTLETTRQVISEMNTQFGQMQVALGVIIAKVEETTTGQLKTGKEQTEALSSLMHGLMNKLQETADQSLNSVQSQLTRVVGDLTGEVTVLSMSMMNAARNMADHSQQSANAVIDKTDAWTEATAKRLESLLTNIENRSKDFKEASSALLEAKTFMSNLLTQNATALSKFAEASRSVQAYSSGLAGQSDALKTLSGDQAKVAGQLHITASAIRASLDQNEKMLGEYRRTVAEYRAVIENLHEPLTRIMQATSNGLRDYNQSVERNFTKIVEVAGDLVPKVANLLSVHIEELGTQLGDLGDVVSKAVERANGRTR